MKQSHRILIIIGIVLLAVNIWSLFRTSSNIEAIQNNITKSKLHIDTALSNLESSMSQLDSIDNRMVRFSNYVTGVQDAVTTMNIKKNDAERKSDLILKELRKNAQKAKEGLDVDNPPPAIKITSL